MSIEAEVIIKAFKDGKKLYACGNGGSLGLASHFVGELISHYPRSYPAISLSDGTVLTAIANDYDFSEIYTKQIKILGELDDILVIFSASKIPDTVKHSLNLSHAYTNAINHGLKVILAPRKGKTTEEIQENQLHWLHSLAKEINDNYDNR